MDSTTSASDANLFKSQEFYRTPHWNLWEFLTSKKPGILYLVLVGFSFLVHADHVLISVISSAVILLFLIFRTDIGAVLWVVMTLLAPDREVYKLTVPGKWIISNSFFLNSMNGFTFIVLIIVISLGFFLCYLMISPGRIHYLIFWVLLLPFIIPMHGFLHTSDMRIAISDSRYLFAPVAMFLALKASRVSAQTLMDVFSATLLVKALTVILLSYILTEPGLTYWGYTTYLLPLLLPLNYNKSVKVKLILTVIVFICIFTYPARGRIICFLYALGIMLFAGGQKYRVIVMISAGIIAIFVIPPLIVEYADAMWMRYILWKFNTYSIFSSSSISANMRLVEFLNIMSEQIRQIYPMFIGKGYGGYFVDNFIEFDYSALIGGSAFPDAHIYQRTFFDPHTNINFMLLKSGLFSTLFFFCGLAYFAFMRKYRYCDPRARYLMLYLPILGVVMVAIKISLIFGAFLFVLNQLLLEKRLRWRRC